MIMKHGMGFLRALGACMALLVALAALPTHAAEPQTDAANRALAWLVGQQGDDGSIGGDAGATADAVTAMVAMGVDPDGVLKNGNSPVSYLGAQAATYAAKSVGGAGKLTLAVIAAGKDPSNFGGVNLINMLQKSYNSATGQYGPTTTDHVFALLALASAGQTVPPAAVAALEKLQLADGGWSYDGTVATGSDTNTTALAVQALKATSGGSAALPKAQAYLLSQQNADGGFPYSKTSPFGSDSDANSTAYVIQALVALGVDPATLKQGANTPLTALLALQNTSGAFRYQTAIPDDNIFATEQAIPALLLKSFPLKTAVSVRLWLPLLSDMRAISGALKPIIVP
jgi:hypothetical protein